MRKIIKWWFKSFFLTDFPLFFYFKQTSTQRDGETMIDMIKRKFSAEVHIDEVVFVWIYANVYNCWIEIWTICNECMISKN